MTKYIFTALFIGFYFQFIAQAKLKFADPKKNFGFVKNGEEVKLSFSFTNTGNQPLLIDEAKATCSCTRVIWPKEPVLPNQSKNIEVIFDTSPAHGRQDRIIEVFSNDADSPQKIRFKGVVLK
jgi:hypothetical protein